MREIKEVLDNSVDMTIDNAPVGGTKFEKAREAYKKYRGTFKQKDLIENLIKTKSGTSTPVIPPDGAISKLVTRSSYPDFKKVMAIVGNNPAALNAIMADVVSDLFDKSLTRGIDGEITAISGAKLSAAWSKIPEERLHVIFKGNKDILKELEDLVETITIATIPIPTTQNPSGTSYKLIGILSKIGNLQNALIGNLTVGSGWGAAVPLIAGWITKKNRTSQLLKGIPSGGYGLDRAVSDPLSQKFDLSIEQVVQSQEMLKSFGEFRAAVPDILTRAMVQGSSPSQNKNK
jgi:hypothetical protein